MVVASTHNTQVLITCGAAITPVAIAMTAAAMEANSKSFIADDWRNSNSNPKDQEQVLT